MNNFMTHPTAIREENVSIGDGSFVWAFAHLRAGASVGNQCVIGGGVYVDTGVRIGNRVHVQNRALLYRPLEIDDDVFIGPAVIFANDKLPRSLRIRDVSGSRTVVRAGASIGAGAIILPDLTIGRYALVGAGAVVTKNVPDHGLVLGSPARLVGYVCFCGNRLPRGTTVMCTAPGCGRTVTLADGL